MFCKAVICGDVNPSVMLTSAVADELFECVWKFCGIGLKD